MIRGTDRGGKHTVFICACKLIYTHTYMSVSAQGLAIELKNNLNV